MSSLRTNPGRLCLFHALQMSLFPMAVLTLYYRHDIGMSMGTIMALQGVFGLAMVLCEFPSGYLADRMGYRRTLILAAILNALGWSIYTHATTFAGIVVAEVILGIGISLISGTDSALLYESLEETGQESEFGKWNGRVRFFGQIGEGSAALLAGFMYAHWHRLPFLFEALIWVVNLRVAWRLVEPARHRPPLEANFSQVKAILRHTLIEDKRLRAIVAITMALGMASYIPVWTIQLYATDAGLSEKYLGVAWAAANYIVAIGSLFSDRAAKIWGLPRLMVICIAMIAIGYLGMGLNHAIWGFGFYYLLTLMRGLHAPVLHHEEHRRIPSRDRAGFISLRSLMFRSSFLVIGPAIGMGIDRHGQHPVLLVVGGLLVIAALVGFWMMRRSGAFDPSLKAPTT